jgi:uncharacterized protein
LTLLYADPSAILRAYFVDEPDHGTLRALLLEGDRAVATSELSRLELASAVRAAARAGRLPHWREVLAGIDADFGEQGPLVLMALRPPVVLDRARRLVLDHRLRSLDAVHLAVALEECPELSGGGEVLFVTRDADQARAAVAEGLEVC